MKTYSKKPVAETIAKKLSAKGEPHSVIEVNGGFQVISDAQLEAMTAAASTEASSEAQSSSETSTETVAEVAGAPSIAPNDIVEIEIMGAKITKDYVITPVLGKRPRWFEKKRLVSVEQIEGGVKIGVTAKALYARGLKDLVKQAAPADAEQTPEVVAA